MAQGGLKKQSSKFVLPSKTRPKGTKKISKKPVGPKRGPRYIAPKKANIVRIEKLKKNLHKVIGQKIEEDLVNLASDKGQHLRILTPSAPGSGSTPSTSGNSTSKGKGKGKEKKKN